MTSVTEIPYFEGDFWPNIIEDTIKELDQEAREREASEAATVEVGGREGGRRWIMRVREGGGRSISRRVDYILRYCTGNSRVPECTCIICSGCLYVCVYREDEVARRQAREEPQRKGVRKLVPPVASQARPAER